MNLTDLPKEKRTRRYIESEIRYEEASGIHTYHQCDCGRMRTRSGRCATCWTDLLATLPPEKVRK